MVDSYRTTLNAEGWTLAGIAIVLVTSRVYVRSSLINRFGWDDAFMAVALLFALVTTSLVTLATNYGFGLHTNDIPDPERRAMALKYTMIPPAICLISTSLSKISVVIFLMRLLGMAAKLYHKILLYSATLIMVGGNMLSIVVCLSYCTPRQRAWKPDTPGTCMDPKVLDLAGRTVTVYNAAMDLLYAGFAVGLVWTLNMKTSTKWGLAVVMSGGVFGTAASIVKAVMMKDIMKTKDMTYSWAPIAIWYTAEMYCIIIAGSIPMLRPLWAAIRGVEYGSSDKYNNNGPESGGYYYRTQRKDKSTGRSMRKSQGGQSCGPAPGLFTIALQELGSDEEECGGSGISSRGGSSVDILQRSKNEMESEDIRGSRRTKSAEIWVTNEIEVGYEGGRTIAGKGCI